MKIAFVMSRFDYSNVENKYGIGYYIAEHFKKNNCEIEYYLHDNSNYEFPFKIKQGIYKYFSSKKYYRSREPKLLKSQTAPLIDKIYQSDCDIAFSFGSLPIAYLNIKKPVFFWTDAFFSGLTNFYEEFTDLSESTLQNGNQIEIDAINNSKKIFVSSQWAKDDAIKSYNVNPDKILVIPFGPNLDINHSEKYINDLIEKKDKTKINLLFLGKEWIRKGGDIAHKITEELNKKGINAKLLVVGCKDCNIQSEYIENYGFLFKSKKEDADKLKELFESSHYLIMPSRAETFGHVFCEANAFGMPNIASKNGGIPSVITNDINGKLIDSIEDITSYIIDKYNNYDDYKRLSMSSFNEFKSKLNWDSSIKTIIEEINSSIS